MKLLMITQKLDMNDSVFGFVPDWINELNKNVSKLYVLSLYKGKYNIDKNISVFSMGKEYRQSKLYYIINLYRTVIPLLYKKKIDGIFVHQGGLYPILLWLPRIIFGVKLLQWKTHSIVNLIMKTNILVSDKILTASNTCFNNMNVKIKVLGHGINTKKFKKENIVKEKLIIVIGRITNVKKINKIIEIFLNLIKDEKYKEYRLEFYGIPLTKIDLKYFIELKRIVLLNNKSDKIIFKGKVNHEFLPKIYNKAKVLLNIGSLRSLDKVILESMACETPAIMSTEAIIDQLGLKNNFLYSLDSSSILLILKKILSMNIGEYEELGVFLRNLVIKNHSIDSLMKNIVNEFKKD